MTQIPTDVLADINALHSYALFGSREMASRPPTLTFNPALAITIDSATDWDFSAPATAHSISTLHRLGYECAASGNSPYLDVLAHSVWAKSYNDARVHVVLRKQYPLFITAWRSIDAEFYADYIWKRSSHYECSERSYTRTSIKEILNQLYRTAQASQHLN